MKSGYIKIDKEPKFTSKDVDSCVKKRLDQPKVGHLGTLDPFATGLLLCLVNDGTRITTLVADSEKEYIATLQLGATTPSMDSETPISEASVIPSFNEEKINSVFKSFLGKQKQIPPLYSAKHVKGIKAYALAREGAKITLPPVDIEIKELELISYQKECQQIIFRTVVSKGTYIRVLGYDIAKKLGTLGYLISLRRTRIGPITLDGAVKINDASLSNLRDVRELCPNIPSYNCDDVMAFRIKNGQTIPCDELKMDSEYLFLCYDNVLLAIYHKVDDVYRAYKGYRHEK